MQHLLRQQRLQLTRIHSVNLMYEGKYENLSIGFNDPKHIKFVIVGSRYRTGYPGFLGEIAEGDPIELVHAPDNPWDPYAVEAWINGRWVGFIPQGGTACLDCGEPYDYGYRSYATTCPKCGSESIGKGGLAFRLVKQELLAEAKAFVTAIDDDNEHQPIHGELWTP